MIKTMMITGSFPPMKCGVGDYTAQLVNVLSQKNGVRICVLTGQEAQRQNLNDNVELFNIIENWHLGEIHKIRDIIEKWRPNIIHIQFPTQGYRHKILPWLIPLLSTRHNIKIVQTWHEYFYENKFAYILNGIIFRNVIVVRPNFKDNLSFLLNLLFKFTNIHYIPNASNVPVIQLSPIERSEIKNEFNAANKKLITYFGFIYPHKRLEILFEITNPDQHHLLIIGDFNMSDPYHQFIYELALKRGLENVSILGYVPEEKVAKYLAASDAVVLPFLHGGGIWNTSIHAAAIQGSFILTTSLGNHGYDIKNNIYFSLPNDIDEMRKALLTYQGVKCNTELSNWDDIADYHILQYNNILI
jgi:glycosyltransferase involved in cell wall biosynthesis